MDMENALAEARKRGRDRGENDRAEGFYNDSPLSGEWAGESIRELLGDLVDSVSRRGETDATDWETYADIENDLCEEYETGYNEAHETV